MTPSNYYTYILKCGDKNKKITYYTGFSINIKRRILQHYNKTGAKYTKDKEILSWVYYIFNTRSEALREEKRIKKLSPTEKEEMMEEVFVNDEWDWNIIDELDNRGFS